MVDKIILELPADTVGGDILVSTETRERAEQAVEDAEAQVTLAAGQVGLAAAQVTLASGEADRAEDARDQAEQWAGNTQALQDAAVAGVIQDTQSIARGALDELYSGQALTAASVLTPDEHMAILADFTVGSKTICFVGDSTGNDVNEYVGLVAKHLYGPQLDPKIRREYWEWNATTEAYVVSVDNAGEGTPATGGTEIADTFDTARAELVGFPSSSGGIWGGGVGKWSSQDGKASTTGGALEVVTSSRDTTIEAQISLVTSGTGVNRRIDFYVGGSSESGGNYKVFGYISVNLNGLVTGGIFKTAGGTTTTLTSGPIAGLVDDSLVPQTMTVKIELSIQQVAFTVTPQGQSETRFDAVVPEIDYSNYGTHAGVFAPGSMPRTVFEIDSITISTPFTPVKYNKLVVVNACVAGASLSYHQSRLAEMFPIPIDGLFINIGHNYKAQLGSDFLVAVDAFVAAYGAAHPETVLGVISQNPQFEPAANVVAHADRQAALRAWARENGAGYVPVFEAFSALPDGGRSLVNVDGIHPSSPPAPFTPVAGYGSTLIAEMVQRAIDVRRAT